MLVTQPCPTLCSPMDRSPPGPSVHGILQASILEGLPFPSPGDLPHPGIKHGSPTLQASSLPSEPSRESWEGQKGGLETHRVVDKVFRPARGNENLTRKVMPNGKEGYEREASGAYVPGNGFFYSLPWLLWVLAAACRPYCLWDLLIVP